jgi:membrane-bound lytic murein transglycosylase D
VDEPAPAPVAAAATAAKPKPAATASAKEGHVVVEVGETLGHYASWLDTTPDTLRRMNGMRKGAGLVVGQRVRVSYERVSSETFAARRQEHHAAVRKEFFENFRVAGTSVHVLRAGETVWGISQRSPSVPIWLLREYNPDVDLGALRPGAKIQIPRLEPKAT